MELVSAVKGFSAIALINGFRSPINSILHCPFCNESPIKKTFKLKLNFAKPWLENKINSCGFASTFLMVIGVMPLILKEHSVSVNLKSSTLSSGKIDPKFLKSLKKSNKLFKVDCVELVSLIMVKADTEILFN